MIEKTMLSGLERQVAALTDAVAPADVFRRLLDGCRIAVPRAVIFLSRDGRLKGWGSAGYPSEAAAALKGRVVHEPPPGFAAAEASDEPWTSVPPETAVPGVDEPSAAESLVFPVRVGARALALLVAERGPSEEPWHPEVVAVMVHAARLRLELDLALRRSKGGVDAPVARAAEPAPAPLEPVAATAPPEPVEVAPWDEPHAPPPDPRRDDARRFARLVATDIRLYNEEAVVTGRKQRDLAIRLADALSRGRDTFSRRFSDLGPDGDAILTDAFVQVLAGGDASLLS